MFIINHYQLYSMEYELTAPITIEELFECDRVKIIEYSITIKTLCQDIITYDITPIKNGILKNIVITKESIGNIIPIKYNLNECRCDINSHSHLFYNNVSKNDEILSNILKIINENINKSINKPENGICKVYLYK